MKKGVALTLIIVLSALLAGVIFFRKAGTPLREVPVHPESSGTEETLTVEIETPATPFPEPEPTPEPVQTPIWEKGTVTVYDIGILYRTAARGEVAEIVGEEGDYYRIRLDDKTLFIEKRFIKDVSESIPEEKTAYALNGAECFSSPYLTGEPLETLKLNTPITVIEEFGELLLAKTDTVQGYIDASSVSSVRIVWSFSEGGGGGEGNDGGDISLGYRSSLRPVAGLFLNRMEEEKSESIPEQGRILADGAELYLQITAEGDTLMVISAEEQNCCIWTGMEIGTFPRWALRMEGDEVFSEWQGFANSNAKLFEDYRFAGSCEKLKLNTVITVLLQTDRGCYVEANGHRGYMKETDISQKQIVWSAGGESSDGSSGEWTAPVL